MVAAVQTWNAGPTGPKTVTELRVKMTQLAKRKTGKALISDEFSRDHVFAGHAGSVADLAKALARLRTDRPLSTLLTTPMDANAQKEVLNWIEKVPDDRFTRAGTVWTVAGARSTVPGVATYKWATVDLAAFKAMNTDDREKKSRNWLKETQKTPKVACWFSADGTPVIYHLDY